MTTTISYANVAKSKISDVPVNVSESSSSVMADEPLPVIKKENEKEKKDEKKPKVQLAPAPVPEKSVWGATRSESAVRTVDEQKWPTPDRAASEQQANGTIKSQKFIKPITNKWVPINAKVILPSAKSGSQRATKSKKNKKSNNTKKHSSQNSQNNKQNESQVSGSTDGSSEHGEIDKSRANSSGASSQSKAKKVANGNSSPTYKQKNGGQQRNQANPGYPNTNSAHGTYFQPQLYNAQPQADYQNFGARSFRPNNRYQNRGYRTSMPVSNGFMGSPMYLSSQLPPPISPKQDPQEALSQQIDYYFSLENLIKDIFLRKNMDSEGWIPLDLVLDFKRVKLIVNGIQNSIENKDITTESIILGCLSSCFNLEIKYDEGKEETSAEINDVFLRVKDNYQQWLIPN